MSVKSTTSRVLATVTAAGLLTLGGGAAAFAADSGTAGTGGGKAASVAREHPGALRNAVKTAFTAAADTLGMTPQELRAAVLDGPQSVAAVAGDRAGEVQSAVEAALTGLVDQAEADGTITAEQAAKLRDRVPAAAERLMNRVPQGRPAA